MTDDTSSPSASITTSTDGLPRTGPSSETISDESKASPSMDEVLHILQARYPGYTIIDGTQSRHFRMFRLKAWWGRITHMVGFHWYIEGETYDSATNSVKYSGYHCFYCDREP